MLFCPVCVVETTAHEVNRENNGGGGEEEREKTQANVTPFRKYGSGKILGIDTYFFKSL